MRPQSWLNLNGDVRDYKAVPMGMGAYLAVAGDSD